MKIVMEKQLEDLVTVYAAEYRNDPNHILEFVDSLTGSRDIMEKWVLVVSSQFGCPVGCLMCDTKDHYFGNPTVEELVSQVDFMIGRRFRNGRVPTSKFKVQFARMGEPALNPNVIGAIMEIRERYDVPGFMPCISTTAPEGADEFFRQLMKLNHEIFNGSFQLQFSVHSTDEGRRSEIIPIRKWDLNRISEYGEKFHVGGRKVSLNFAMAHENELDPSVLSEKFSPDVFMIKMTPVNPTEQALMNDLVREDLVEEELHQIQELRDLGFDVVLSVGDLRENQVGSNCGQLAALWKTGSVPQK
ncbi:MAG: radical SAM protein [Thermoplasmatota archaeon]